MTMRITQGVSRGDAVTISIDGKAVQCCVGETVATAMLAAGVTTFRRDLSSAPRGLFCNMGTCMECTVGVREPGAPVRRLRACMTVVRDGLEVITGASGDDD